MQKRPFYDYFVHQTLRVLDFLRQTHLLIAHLPVLVQFNRIHQLVPAVDSEVIRQLILSGLSFKRFQADFRLIRSAKPQKKRIRWPTQQVLHSNKVEILNIYPVLLF